jgi:hypothetical protein
VPLGKKEALLSLSEKLEFIFFCSKYCAPTATLPTVSHSIQTPHERSFEKKRARGISFSAWRCK